MRRAAFAILVIALIGAVYSQSRLPRRVLAFDSVVPGDLNGDGKFDAQDMSLAIRAFLTGDSSILVHPQLADVAPLHSSDPRGYGDGQINADDINLLFRAFLQLTTLPHPPLTVLADSSPQNGEGEVGVKRETILRFTQPLAPNAAPDASMLYAEFAGQKLNAQIHVSADRRFLTLYYINDLPASARVRVTLIGDNLPDVNGVPIDADGDGQPGGTARIDFDTLTLSTTPGTMACGRVFASELAAGMNIPLAGVTITVDGNESKMRATTDANGDFRLDPAPAGEFFVHIDGGTATNGVPAGGHYPVVGKKWMSRPGVETNIGSIYLPLIPAGTLQVVSGTQPTEIHMAPSVLQEHPEFSEFQVTVPPNSLYRADGTPGGMVGIAPVPPDRLPGPLPEGLKLPIVITVQAMGGTEFDKPVPACFPNLPDPDTGQTPAPGDKSWLYSYNHKTGQWEPIGPMTVSADGKLVCTDLGVGIRAPGWHGSGPPPYGPEPTGGPTTGGPTAGGPTAGGPTAGGPTAGGPTAGGPTAGSPTAGSPTAGGPTAGSPTAGGPTAGGPTAGGPTAGGPTAGGPTAGGPTTGPTPECQMMQTIHDVCGGGCSNLGGQCIVGAEIAWEQKIQKCKPQNGGPLDKQCLDDANKGYKADEHTCTESWYDCGQACDNAYPTCPDMKGPLNVSLPRPLGAPPAGTLPPTGDPIADQIHAIDAQISDLVYPYSIVNSTQWPASLVTQVSDLIVQADALAGGDAVGYLKKSQLGLEVAGQTIRAKVGLPPGNAPPYPIPYVAEIQRPSGLFYLRGRTGPYGRYSLFVPRDGTLLSIRFYDPRTKRYGVVHPFADPAMKYLLPNVTLTAVDATYADYDQDGLPDVVELVYGTDPTKPDTNGDGILDGASVDQGIDPLGSFSAQTGILATAAMTGTALDVCAFNDLAVVAGGSAGITVFNVYNGMNPTIIAQVGLPGTAQAVACSGSLIAVAGGSAGLSIVDISDPPAAKTLYQLDLNGSALSVATSGDKAYIGLDTGDVVTVDLQSGVVLDDLSVSGSPVQDVAVSGDTLYALAQGTFFAIPLTDGPLAVSGMASAPGAQGAGRRRLRLFAGGKVGYSVFTQGYDTFDLTDPLHPALNTAGSSTQFGWRQVVANGAGPGALGFAAVGNNSTDDGSHDVSLYDVSDPTKTSQFLTAFPMPGSAAAVTIYNGLGYVADGPSSGRPTSSLDVVSYLPYDNKGKAPTISLSTDLSGSQAVEGTAVLAKADVSDDVQVRNVEFYIDGVKAVVDGNYPFEYRFLAPSYKSERSFRLKARVSDTGGNFKWSDETVISVTQDVTPLHILRSFPASGGYTGPTKSISATFSRPLKASTLTGSTFAVYSAGPDGLPGTADDVLVPGGTVSYSELGRTAYLTFVTALTPGTYHVAILPPLADQDEKALAAAVTWNFQVVTGTDLIPTALNAPGTVRVSNSNPQINVSWSVANQGVAAKASWVDRLYLSSKPTIDSTAVTLGDFAWNHAVAAGTRYSQKQTIGFRPPASGSYFLILVVNVNQQANLVESNYANNTLSIPITVEIANLKPTAISIPNFTIRSTTPNPQMIVSWTVANQGTGATASGAWRDLLYVSTKPVLDTTAQAIYQTAGISQTVAPGSSYTLSTDTPVRLPLTTSGTYYLLVKANFDLQGGLYESDYTDNVLASAPIVFNLTPANLKPTAVTSSSYAITSTFPRPQVMVSWTVANQGVGATTPGAWRDLLYFSTKSMLDNTAVGLYQTGPLTQTVIPGADYTIASIPITLPIAASGTYYLLVKTNFDLQGGLYESDYTDNVLASAPIRFTLNPADLHPASVTSSSYAITLSGVRPQVMVSWTVVNQGIGAANPSWRDLLYLSKNPVLDGTAQAFYQTGPLMQTVAPGASYTVPSIPVNLPIDSPGTYYLLVKTNYDLQSGLYESDYTNNVAASAAIIVK